MMRVGKRVSWLAASVLAFAVAGCCDSDHPLGVRESNAGAQGGVALGTASTYGVLAGTSVTNTGATTIDGDLGLDPGSSVTGFPPGTVIGGGATNVNNAAAIAAKVALTTAYNDAAARTTGSVLVAGDLGGRTLAPGLYTSTSTLGITGAVTLHAFGNPNAVFIIQVATGLTTAAGSQIILAGGAQASNIFWQVGTSATLGGNSDFEGTILANTSITLGTGAQVNGRLLAMGGQVAMDTNAIVVP